MGITEAVKKASGEGRMSFDNIDIQMIELLMKNGRMTNVELAERVGLSPPPCLRRLRFLEDEKVILGYKAQVDHKKLGYEVQAMVIVRFVSPKPKIISSFINKIKQLNDVIDIKNTLDGSALILTIVSADLGSYSKLLKSYIQDDNDIDSFQTYILDGADTDSAV